MKICDERGICIDKQKWYVSVIWNTATERTHLQVVTGFDFPAYVPWGRLPDYRSAGSLLMVWATVKWIFGRESVRFVRILYQD